MIRISSILLLVFLSFSGVSQIPFKKLKDAAVRNKSQIFKHGNAVLDEMDKARAEFDSTDFDYAILLSDNSGLFDVKEKGEFTAKFLTLNNLAETYKKEGVDAIYDDASNARSNLEAGELAYAYGRFSFAETRYKTARGLYEKAGLTDDIGYLKTISNQGLLFATMGRYTQAEEATLLALEKRKEKFGVDDLGVAASMNNYGVLHYNLGRYNEAEKELDAVIAIMDKQKVQESMQYSIVLNNQAMLFQAIGRYDAAMEKLEKAIAVAEKLQSKKSNNHLKFISNQALLYQQMGKYAEAESIYLGMEKRMGKNNPDYASMLSNLSALYMIMGKEDKIEDLLKRSISIYKSSFGEENPAFAKATSDLGNFYRYKERFAEAEPLLDKALNVRKKVLGEGHPYTVQSIEDVAILYWKKGDIGNAQMLYRTVMDQSLTFINKYFPPMSEAEKTKYWDVLFPRFQRFYNYAIDAAQENKYILQDLYDYQIATKALLLNSTNKVKQRILASGDKALVSDYLNWLDQKELLARLYAYSKDDLKDQKINLDSIERATNSMEKKLSERSEDFTSGYSIAKTSFKDVQNVLAPEEAIVEIIRVKKYDQKFVDDARYVALVLTKGAELPKMVIWQNGKQMETRYAKYFRNAVQQKMEDTYSYDQFWAGLDPDLSGKKIIYISPDGVYNQISLNTLKKPGGDYVINRYDLVIVGNSKDLITIKSKKATVSKKNITFFGFPDYGPGDVPALPGTKTEVDGISKILTPAGFKTNQFMQKTASETNLKAVKSPTYLHIATHGYFLPDSEGATGSAFGVHLENANDNALLRSGLLLAGAGNALGYQMPNLESNDNGILTAYEAMNLDLQGTDMVVLSACETGLGDIKDGEGVYGLQRSFLAAGADALVMSLWKVDDAATQELMRNFYANLVKLKNKRAAFKQAQLQLMKKYKEPYYWGAFVMMGQ